MDSMMAGILRKRRTGTAGSRATSVLAQKRASVLVAALAAEEDGPRRILHRVANVQRERMDWPARVASLTTNEFIARYRVDLQGFEELCEKIRPMLKRMTGTSVAAELKLSCALRFLCGAQKVDVADLHGLGESTAIKYLWATLACIDAVEELPLMKYLDELEADGESPGLRAISSKYDNRSGGVMTGCIGALDGLAIKVYRPRENPSHYYCRKGFYSFNMQGICDSDHKFTWCSILTAGATNDGIAISVSSLNQVLSDPEHALASKHYWLSGDDAYKGIAHDTNSLCTPFSGNKVTEREDNWNYYQSSGRMTIECSFGELVGRWGILQRKLHCSIEHATMLVRVLCKLHNICVDRRLPRIAPSGTHPGDGNDPYDNADESPIFTHDITGRSLDADSRPNRRARRGTQPRREDMADAIKAAGMERPLHSEFTYRRPADSAE